MQNNMSFNNNPSDSEIQYIKEDEAKNRGCNNVRLETHDFQAVNFYKKQGYIIRCELNNLPKGHTKYLMTKEL